MFDDLTEEEQEDVLEEFLEDLDDEIDLEEMKYKISNLSEAADVVQENIETLYDAVNDEFDLYLHQGEQDKLNIEELEELKIQEYSEQQKERMEGLKDKMQSRNEMLQSLKERLQEGTGDYDEEIREIEEQLEGQAKPSDLELEELGIDPEDFAEYEEALDLQAELLEDIREAELNLDAMMVEKALGSFADVMNRRYLEPDEASIMRALAELEYKEYLHSIGNVKDIASEPELQHLEIGGYDIDVAHNMNLASDEPLLSGYEKEVEKYRKRSDGDADLFLTGHHGVLHAEPYIHGRGEDANDHTWVVQLPTFLDKEAMEEYGEDAGLNLLKDVKRLNKDLFSSAATMLEMKVEEGPDGELRQRLVIEGWDEEYLKNLGRQLEGENFPGRDFTEDDEMEHIIARGDDQIGAPHSLKFLYEPLIEEVIDEDFYNIHDWIDDYDIDPSEVTVVEGGDAFQGNDIYPAQMTEGGMHQGRQELELKEAVISQFEDADVEFETREDYYGYLEDNDLDSMTMKALDYLEVRNRAQVPITSLGKQGERVEELVEEYEQLIEEGASFIGVDGNHFNRNHEGMEEAKRISQMISSDLKKSDRVQTASGLDDGDGTFEIGDLQVRIKHRPTGRGRSNRSKQVNQTIEEDTDVVVNADKHIPGFSFKDGVQYVMPGSAQATNLFVKGFTDAPAESGAVYLSRSRGLTHCRKTSNTRSSDYRSSRWRRALLILSVYPEPPESSLCCSSGGPSSRRGSFLSSRRSGSRCSRGSLRSSSGGGRRYSSPPLPPNKPVSKA